MGVKKKQSILPVEKEGCLRVATGGENRKVGMRNEKKGVNGRSFWRGWLFIDFL